MSKETSLIINCSWTKFMAIIVIVLVFFMQIFRLTILRFSSGTFFDFSSDFFTPSLFIFEWSLLLSLWSKACCYKIGCSAAINRVWWQSGWCMWLKIGRSMVWITVGSEFYLPASFESNSSDICRFIFYFSKCNIILRYYTKCSIRGLTKYWNTQEIQIRKFELLVIIFFETWFFK